MLHKGTLCNTVHKSFTNLLNSYLTLNTETTRNKKDEKELNV